MHIKKVTDYLDNIVNQYPKKKAFCDESREETFAEVKSEAERIASSIIEKKVFKKPIAIFMDKRVECINAFIGVTYSGNFYTVLDTKMPLVRIQKILHVLMPEIIITDYEHYDAAKQFCDVNNILLYEDMMKNGIDSQMLEKTKQKIIETDVLYVLFTSGSTGEPKGVVISHKAVIAYVEWGTVAFEIDSETIFGNQTPFYFVMSGFDIYQTLRNGCTMYIIPKNMFSFPMVLLEYLNKKRINTLYWVPSVLCLVANFRALPVLHLDCLKTVMFGGEVMPTKQLNMWRKEYPNVSFINMYGPTELTDVCTFYIVDREFKDSETLPIGKASDHMHVLLLDKDDKEVEYGEVGELCGRGPSLAYGYYNNSEKTKETFVQNPLNDVYPELIYRTGDLVQYNDRGELIYLCRKDFQIKHLGHRIELGEIETAISALDGIDRNCCLYDTEKSKIVMFYTGTLQEELIDKELKLLLPEYMLPNKKIKLDEMPLNINGKIDRLKLKDFL